MRKFIILASALAITLVNCQGEQASKEHLNERAAPETTHAPETPLEAVPETPASTSDAPPSELTRLETHVYHLMDKRSCNRVMGCDPEIAIMQFGRDATPTLLEAFRRNPIDGRYWQIKAIDILGQLGDTRALPVLISALEQARWEVRCRSAVALGRIADARAEAPLRALLATNQDVATTAAALFGLSALKQSVDGIDARDALITHLPRQRDALGALNPGHFAFLAELVGLAQLRESLPVARWGALHKDRFTRMAALETLAQLKDRQGIPFAITRLDDTSPGVRRQALRTLRVITGRRAFTRPEHWSDWCEQRKCLEPLRALNQPSPPGGTIEPRREDASRGDVRGEKDNLKQGDHDQQGRARPEAKDKTRP